MTTEQLNGVRKPIAEGYFTWPSEAPSLIVSHCKSCGTYRFPRSAVCHNPQCQNGDVQETTLSRRGRLWTYTIVYYPPPAPFRSREPFTPYAIGLVDFPEGVRVVGMLTGCPVEEVRIGMPVEVVAETQYEDEIGNEYLTWKFKPLAG